MESGNFELNAYVSLTENIIGHIDECNLIESKHLRYWDGVDQKLTK